MSPQVKERIPVVIAEYDEVSRVIARRIADVIAERREAGGHAVLGLATGSTPIGIYRELARLHREEGLDFSDVVTFNLDEYFPMRPESIHSYNRYMWENLFDEIDVKPENVHVPRGDVPREQIAAETAAYEQA
ncbi:MAG: 6-phosphogluconolactonase, partial [Gemmatimonadaceae bacterium]